MAAWTAGLTAVQTGAGRVGRQVSGRAVLIVVGGSWGLFFKQGHPVRWSSKLGPQFEVIDTTCEDVSDCSDVV